MELVKNVDRTLRIIPHEQLIALRIFVPRFAGGFEV